MIDFKSDFTIPLDSLPADAKPFNMIWINEGDHLMGLPPNQQNFFFKSEADGEYQFQTKISKGYWIGQFPVTHFHWNNIYNQQTENSSEGNHPKFNVTWFQAMLFCKELNLKFKEFIPAGYHFSLPTELHWEYACYANQEPINIYPDGAKGALSVLDQYGMLHEYDELSRSVGQGKPNAWGIYDMLGNVSEWCYDFTADYDGYEFDDWIGNHGVGFDMSYDRAGNMVISGGIRSIRGTAQLASYREYAGASAGIVSPTTIGFRVCLRPITEWDLDDPLLKKEGISILP